MATVIKPPTPLPQNPGQKSIFLAGSIEMDTAEKWQDRFEHAFRTNDVLLFNPRRDDWDVNWTQSAHNKFFREQVEWELAAQEQADIIAMYFDPQTKSPITLLELGLFARSQKLVVCCPAGYWRKGNVDVVCERYRVDQVSTFLGLVERVKYSISDGNS
ncbi:MAG: nucleoside 2-deoxyribosyltransferase domain-containing protein [Anaerolineales bacterium]|nr:nucleoside 2-deoxyribosyltransferase domain-containing protein [Anaerolineales bacterium]